MNCGMRVWGAAVDWKEIQEKSSKNLTELAEAKKDSKTQRQYCIKEKVLNDFKTETAFYCLVSKAVFNL